MQASVPTSLFNRPTMLSTSGAFINFLPLGAPDLSRLERALLFVTPAFSHGHHHHHHHHHHHADAGAFAPAAPGRLAPPRSPSATTDAHSAHGDCCGHDH